MDKAKHTGRWGIFHKVRRQECGERVAVFCGLCSILVEGKLSKHAG